MTRAALHRVLPLFAAMLFACAAVGQPAYGPPAEPASPLPGAAAQRAVAEVDALAQQAGSPNPVSLLQSASRALPGEEEGLSGALNILILLTVLALAPSIVLMTTCFVRIIIVFGLLKQALGAQNLPPSQVLLSLALFMTFVVMAPTYQRVYDEAVAPYQRGEIKSQLEMWERAKAPIRDFMFRQIEATGNWSSLYLFLNYKGVDTSEPDTLTRGDVDTMTLAAAYMLSELKTAFVMGFRVYLPFLIIDMIIASLLISMSMMMLPPVLVSMPFKILLFVLVDGWTLVVGSLMTSVAQPQTVQAAAAALGGG